MENTLTEQHTTPTRSGEYQEKGDYHRQWDKKWTYLPVYSEKMVHVRKFLANHKSAKILDVGCGEGVLVDEYKNQGYDIQGVDQNYESASVKKGSILELPYESNSFDVVTCLDVIEHLNLMDQSTAVKEINRVLKPGGIFYATIPNLAHLGSRLSMLVTGKLVRTSEVARHPGDRPYSEYMELLRKDFLVEKTFGIFPTFPLISFLTLWIPSKVVWLHRIYNKLFAVTSLCFLNFYVCRKRSA